MAPVDTGAWYFQAYQGPFFTSTSRVKARDGQEEMRGTLESVMSKGGCSMNSAFSWYCSGPAAICADAMLNAYICDRSNYEHNTGCHPLQKTVIQGLYHRLLQSVSEKALAL